MSSNLIIGLAHGYSFDKVKPFVDSLTKQSYNGELILIANESMVVPSYYDKRIRIKVYYVNGFSIGICKKVLLKISSAGIFKSLINVLLKLSRKISEDLFLKLFINIYSPLTARFASYYSILKREKYNNILLADIRDIVFQGDPFEGFSEKLAAFEELYSIRDDEKHNGFWIKKGFNNEVFESIADNRICCAGTIMGSYEDVLHFLKTFLSTCLEWKIPHYGIIGIDQGVYNFLVHTKRLNGVVKHPNGERVLTYTDGLLHRIQFDEGKLLIDYAIPAIIHQYDRNSDLENYLKNHVIINN